jgi:hypothetical protein
MGETVQCARKERFPPVDLNPLFTGASSPLDFEWRRRDCRADDSDGRRIEGAKGTGSVAGSNLILGYPRPNGAGNKPDLSTGENGKLGAEARSRTPFNRRVDGSGTSVECLG